MLKERFKVKVGVFLVIFKDDAVLLLRRYNTGIADGRHVLPMGGLDDEETVTQAIIREAFEEINVLLQPSRLKVAHVMHRQHFLPDGSSFPQLDIFFVPSSYTGTIENKEPHKCDELRFYPLDSLPSTIEPFIEQALHCILKGQIYSECGWPQDPVDCSPTIYESSASTYDCSRSADPVLVNQLMNHLEWNKQGRYLDIGCGSGNYTIALANKGLQIEGVDLSAAMLAKAKAKANGMLWSEGDMRALPYESNLFEGALTMNTLHYVRSCLVPTFLEMQRVLKPGGKLVIFAMGLEQCLQFWLGHYFPFFWELGHQILATRETLISALKEAHFQDIDVEPFFVTENTEDLFTYACKYRPHLFLDPVIRRNMTPMQLPEHAEEVEQGCEHLKRDIASGAIYRIIAKHESNLGEGLIISAKKSGGIYGITH